MTLKVVLVITVVGPIFGYYTVQKTECVIFDQTFCSKGVGIEIIMADCAR